MRAWAKAEAEAMEKAEITRVAAQNIRKANAEAEERAKDTVRERDNAANSAVEEDATEIRVREEV